MFTTGLDGPRRMWYNEDTTMKESVMLNKEEQEAFNCIFGKADDSQIEELREEILAEEQLEELDFGDDERD